MKKDLIGILIIAIIILAGIHYLKDDKKVPVAEKPKEEPVVVQNLKYGIPVDSFITETGIIRRNQVLGDILNNYGVPYSTIDTVARLYKEIFDVRKIRVGNMFMAFVKPDSSQNYPLQYLIYEQNLVNYIVFDFTDSVDVYIKQKKSHVEEKVAVGIIESSLWNALAGNDINPVLSIELSEIYAWSIDFFGLQKGDYFKVVYKEEFVDSNSIGIKHIDAALFNHMGTDFYAFPFVQDSVESYYDEEGQSLRKAFLKAPLNYSRISSRFSNSRLHPVLKIRRPHHGVDYAAPVGTPVVAIGDGKVILAQYNGGAGRQVKIKHNSMYTTGYMHLSRFGKGISPGKYVKQGDIIGYVGSTGMSTGPHLDFRFYKNGVAVDPLKVEAPPVEPVKKENMKAYNKLKKTLKKQLDKI